MNYFVSTTLIRNSNRFVEELNQKKSYILIKLTVQYLYNVNYINLSVLVVHIFIKHKVILFFLVYANI